MKKILAITKENMQKLQDMGYNQPEIEALKNLSPDVVPCIKIRANIGFIASWYNKCVDEVFQLHRIMIEEKWMLSEGREKYVNYIVRSRDKGTKAGYQSMGNTALGKGFDLVHQQAGELVGIKMPEQPRDSD